MIESMTGFGTFEKTFNNSKIQIKIKSLNSKTINISTRLPDMLTKEELTIRKQLETALKRGKIDFEIYIKKDNLEQKMDIQINNKLADFYMFQFKSFVKKHKIKKPDFLSAVLRQNKIFEKIETEDCSLYIENNDLYYCINQTIKEVQKFRQKEGFLLYNEFTNRIQNLQNLLFDLSKFEDLRITQIKNKIFEKLKNLPSEIEINSNRLEQEFVYYIEKLDITEEKTRLTAHFDFFISTLNSENSEGKKLSFITQEIGREINTIGSKANQTDIQHIIVEMKDELEKIKEQLNNIL